MKQMRRTMLYAWVAAAVCLSAVVLGCSGSRQEADAQEEEEVADAEWPAMDDFHMLIAESFHPFKDSSNLEPARLNAAAMAESAAQWLQSPLPKQVDSEEVRGKLKALAETTAAFVETVQAANDEMTAAELEAIHDIFHELQEEWYAHHSSGHEDH